MKRLGSSDSLGALITICPSTEEHSPRNSHVYGRDPFQSMMLEGVLEEEGCVEEGGHHSEKKRRLSVEQVKALEKNFEVENKLEPERKVKLAQELGLQPRQVAVWFQNRRARWKTKQLERDFGLLKSTYEALKVNHDALKQDNEALHKEIKELRSRLQDGDNNNTASGVLVSVKEEMITTMPETQVVEKANQHGNDDDADDDPSAEASIPGTESNDDHHLNYEMNCFNEEKDGGVGSVFPCSDQFKDGSASDSSDSSAILNEENNNSPKGAVSSSSYGVLQNHLLMSPSPVMNNCFQFQKPFHQQQGGQYVKMEEHNFFSADEACNFFSDEQAPTLHWYCSDQWG